MRPTFQAGRRLWTRQLHATARRRLAVPPVESTSSATSLDDFRQRAMAPGKPLIFQDGPGSPVSSLPAATKWFSDDDASSPSPLSSHMSEFLTWPFQYELVTPTPDDDMTLVAFRDWLLQDTHDITHQLLAGILEPAISEPGPQRRRFTQLHAPLQLLARALAFNRARPPGLPPLQLYIAQSALADLPAPLQADLPAPAPVAAGDLYGSSVWLGAEPTYTPLHRDPNPNLLCQLRGRKRVRLLPPARGEQLFFAAQAEVRRQGAAGARSSRIRTAAEMMEGAEREALHFAVWESERVPDELCEAELGPGDALFVPKGWWHSVKSKLADGGLNGSVNWWFR